MNEDHIERLLQTGARTVVTVAERWIKDEQRFRKVPFLVSEADKVELRDLVVSWMKARRQV